MDVPWGWLAAAAAAVLVLRRLSERRVEIPPGAARAQEEERAAGEEDGEAEMEAWEGEHAGAEFSVESLDSETWTVWIDAEETLSKAFEADVLGGRSPELDPARTRDVLDLVKEGARRIDVGKGADWVAAEFPIESRRMDRAKAERIVERLVRLRNASR